MKEAGLQRKVIALLKTMEPMLYWFKVVRANRCGIADIVGWKAGRPFVIELKSPEKESTTHAKLQDYEREKAGRAMAATLKSNDYNVIAQFLIEL